MIEKNITFITTFTSAEINLQCCYQIVVSMDHPFDCTLNGTVYSDIHGFIINKRQRYEASTTHNTRVLVCYLEDGTILGDAIRNKMDEKDILTLNRDISSNLIDNFVPDLDVSIEDLRFNVSRFYEWLLRSDHTKAINPARKIDPRITEIMKYIEMNIKNKITLKTVASLVFLSVDRARHLFLEETGTTISQYILWKRAQQTVYKVVFDKWTLSDACIFCGFNDISHFSRIFKNMFGIPPKQTINNLIFLSMPDIYSADN